MILVNVRPSELIYAASYFAFIQGKKCEFQGTAIEVVAEKQSQFMILKISPSSTQYIPGKLECI